MVTATVRYPGSSVLTTTTTAFKIGQAQAATPFIAGRVAAVIGPQNGQRLG